jgi:hypothetical protein
MDAAYLSALSALAGSVVGGLTTGVSNLLSQVVQARAERRAREQSRKEDLYKDFILAASRAYGKAIVSSEPHLQEIISLYALVSRMRVSSSPEIVACSDKVMRTTVGTYLAPNKTIPQLHTLMESGADIDLLRDFAETARKELQASR